jgi:hypothetical protein
VRAGHDVRTTDLDRVLDPNLGGDYWQADVTDAGACFALARGSASC